MTSAPALDPSAARAAADESAPAMRMATVECATSGRAVADRSAPATPAVADQSAAAARADAVERASTARAATVELYAAARPAVAMAGLSSGQLVELVGECEAGIRSFEAARTLALARLAATEEVVREDGTVEEVSQGLGYRRLDAPDLVSEALGLSAQAAGARVDDAIILAAKLPSLVDAMGAGRVDAYRAGIIATELREAPRAVCDQVLARVDGYLAKPGWVLRQRTRRALEVLDKDCLITKTRRARSALGLRMVPNEDSTDTWTAVLPTEQSRAAWAAVEPLAKQIRDTDGCTLDLARAKAMTQLMLGNCSSTFHVHFAVPADQADDFAARFTGGPPDPTTPETPESDPARDGDEPAAEPAATASMLSDADSQAPAHDPSATRPPATTPDPTTTESPKQGPAANPSHAVADDADSHTSTDDPSATPAPATTRPTDASHAVADADSHASADDPSSIRAPATTQPTDASHAVADADLVTADPRDDPVVVTGLGTAGTTIVPAGWLADVLAGRHGPVEADTIGCDPITGGFVTEPIPLARPGRVTDRDPGTKPPDRRGGSMPRLVTKAYRPAKACRAYVTARDQHCRFPGCTASAYFTDLDHVRAWPSGPTAPGNLACLCRRHHRIKQRPGWTVRMHPDGSMDWTDPTGRVRTTFPVDHLGATVPKAGVETARANASATSPIDFGDATWDGDYQDPDSYTGGIPLWLAAERDLADRLRVHRQTPQPALRPDQASPLEEALITIFHARLDRPDLHRMAKTTPTADFRWLAS